MRIPRKLKKKLNKSYQKTIFQRMEEAGAGSFGLTNPLMDEFEKIVFAVPDAADRKILIPEYGWVHVSDPIAKEYLEHLTKNQ